MFRCYFCKQVTPPKTKRHNIVIATREKEYPTRRSESKRPRGRFRPREDAVQDSGGKGTETAQEVSACPACAAKHEQEQALAQPPAPVQEDAIVAAAPESEVTPAPESEVTTESEQ